MRIPNLVFREGYDINARYSNSNYDSKMHALQVEIEPIIGFLKTPTPKAWLSAANANLHLLLVDHAHCERKAALSALQLINAYPTHRALVKAMTALAREELQHFAQVLKIMDKHHIKFHTLSAANYAKRLYQAMTHRDGLPYLGEQLLVGAIIEARSCERFFALLDVLEHKDIRAFYERLIHSEARHYESYLKLAYNTLGEVEAKSLLDKLIAFENTIILERDFVFRFHSGPLE